MQVSLVLSKYTKNEMRNARKIQGNISGIKQESLFFLLYPYIFQLSCTWSLTFISRRQRRYLVESRVSMKLFLDKSGSKG
jgi:hypothetical protein